MKITKSTRFFSTVALCLLLLGSFSTAQAQSTQFSYQGRLTDNSLPANASYDFQFKLFDAVSGGAQIGSTVSSTNVAVASGIFTVTLDFGAGAFPGPNRFLEINVRLAGGGAFTTLAPRQPVTSTPYAIKSLNAANAAVADNLSASCNGCVTSTQIGSLPTGSTNYVQNGTALQTSSNFRISGVGSAQTIQARGLLSVDFDNSFNGDLVNNLNALKFGGAAGLAPGTEGIASKRTAGGNQFGLDFFTNNVSRLAISNGGNVGIGTTAPAAKLEVVGDIRSSALRQELTASSPNAINGFMGTGSGGATPGNRVTAGVVGASIGGGGFNGTLNFPNVDSILGDKSNRVTDWFGTVGGGVNNRAGNDDATLDNALFATVGGGTSNTASRLYATVGGGYVNTASGEAATVGGGQSNIVSGMFATVSGGYVNTASGRTATVGGGFSNTASGSDATVGGGYGNTASGGAATVGGGLFNTASGIFATVSGGNANIASGNFSYAAGRRASANHDGAFVWADSNDADFMSTGANRFLIRAAGGVGIGTNAPLERLHVSGGNILLDNNQALFMLSAGGTPKRILFIEPSDILRIGSGGDAGVNQINFDLTTGNVMSLLSNGNVGIGTSAPDAKLHVSGGSIMLDNNQAFFIKDSTNTAKRVLFAGADNVLRIGSGGGGGFTHVAFDLPGAADVLWLTPGGNVGVGTSSPADKLQVLGDLRVGTGTTGCVKDADGSVIAGVCSSDLRFKKNVAPLSQMLSKVAQLQPVNFFWRTAEFPHKHFGTKESFGLIAQEVEAVLPELVTTDEQGYKAVNYSKLPLLTIQAVKELKAENHDLKTRLVALEQLVQQLKVQAEKQPQPQQ